MTGPTEAGEITEEQARKFADALFEAGTTGLNQLLTEFKTMLYGMRMVQGVPADDHAFYVAAIARELLPTLVDRRLVKAAAATFATAVYRLLQQQESGKEPS